MISFKRIMLLNTLVLSLSGFLLAGCEDVQIFKKKVNPYALNPLKDTELEDDTYYVKDSTRFYAVHMPDNGNADHMIPVLDESRVMAAALDDSLIPSHYKDELIAFQSEKLELKDVTLERFKDLGYSIGCYGGTITSDGYLYFERENGLVTGSSLESAIGETYSHDIRISTIDGKALTKEDVDVKAGAIIGLDQYQEYKVGYFVGTKYYEKIIKADTKIYEAYEMFSFGAEYLSDTPNGYMCFNTPDILKSGYYNINGCGLFKYYNFAKGAYDEATIDMNESYYLDERSKIEAYSRQYTVSVPKRVKDFKVIVKYDPEDKDNIDSEYIRGIVFAPDSTKMEMDVEKDEDRITISMAEGMPGDWTVNIMPKTLNIEDVYVENDKAAEEATCEETLFTLPEGRENAEVVAEYTTTKENVEDCVVFGSILTEDGKTYEMQVTSDISIPDSPRYYIRYDAPYLAAGEYVVRIYHHPEETTIQKPLIRDKTKIETDVIEVDG